MRMSNLGVALLFAAAALSHIAVSNAGLLPDEKVKAIAEGLGEKGSLLKKLELSFGQTSPKITVTKAVAGKLALTLETSCKDCAVVDRKHVVVTHTSGGDDTLLTTPYKGDVKLQLELILREPSDDDNLPTVDDVEESRKLQTPSAATPMGLKPADLKNVVWPLINSNVGAVKMVVWGEIPSITQAFGQQFVAPILKKLEDPKLFVNDPVECHSGKIAFAVVETEMSDLTIRMSVAANAAKCAAQFGDSADDQSTSKALDGAFSASYKLTVSMPSIGGSPECSVKMVHESWEFGDLSEFFKRLSTTAMVAMQGMIEGSIHYKIQQFMQAKLPKMELYSADKLKTAGSELAKAPNNKPSSILLDGKLSNLLVTSATANAKAELEVKMRGSLNAEYKVVGRSRRIPPNTSIELALIAKPMSIQLGQAAKTKAVLVSWDKRGLTKSLNLKPYQESELLQSLMKDLEPALKSSILKVLPSN